MGHSPDKCLWCDLGRSILKAGLGSVFCGTGAQAKGWGAPGMLEGSRSTGPLPVVSLASERLDDLGFGCLASPRPRSQRCWGLCAGGSQMLTVVSSSSRCCCQSTHLLAVSSSL